MSNFTLPTQVKWCGHDCYPSSTKYCCSCSDQRPMRTGNTYPNYIDGVGWVDNASRDDGYCPICNPKNYEVWQRKIDAERLLRAEKAALADYESQRSMEAYEEDRRRASQV